MHTENNQQHSTTTTPVEVGEQQQQQVNVDENENENNNCLEHHHQKEQEDIRSSAPLPVANAVVRSYGACEVRFEGSINNKKSGGSSHSSSSLVSSSSSKQLQVTAGDGGYNQGEVEKEKEEEKEEKSLLLRAAKVIPCLGIILALFASLFLGSAGMLVKMTHSVHGIQVAVFRAMIQVVIYGFVISVRRLGFMPKPGEIIPVLARATLGGTSITFSYYALRLIPLGDATTIRFSLPIWTLIVSYLVLNESCSIFKIGAVILAISGVILIAKPDDCIYLLHLLLYSFRLESGDKFNENQLQWEQSKNDPNSAGLSPTTMEPYKQFEGSLLALSSSICLALSLIALRLCKRTPAEITILWLSLISIAIGTSVLLALNEWRLPNNWRDVLFILLNGICGSIGQWFITSALKIEQSGVISLARTFDIEVAFLYSAFLLQEKIRMSSIFGSALVSCGVIAVVVPKWLDSRREARFERQQLEEGGGGGEHEQHRGDNHQVIGGLNEPGKQRSLHKPRLSEMMTSKLQGISTQPTSK